MVRVGSALEILKMAAGATCRNPRKPAAGMTSHTILLHVSSQKLISGIAGMIETGAAPVVEPVAAITSGWQLGGLMIQKRRGLVVLEMAGDAFRAQPGILACRAATVAGFTVNRGVGA